jgi:putative transposase
MLEPDEGKLSSPVLRGLAPQQWGLATRLFVIMEVGTRKIAHFNVTDHPTAPWTIQQFREVITGEQPYRFVLHDRDSIYSTELDCALKSLGVIVLRTPFRAPQANSFCERLVGTIRRECLDFLIPLNQRHVRRILKEWVAHYNQGRPHSSWDREFLTLAKLSQPREIATGTN